MAWNLVWAVSLAEGGALSEWRQCLSVGFGRKVQWRVYLGDA